MKPRMRKRHVHRFEMRNITEPQTRELMREVEKRPCLWNRWDINYGNRRSHSTAWDEVSKLINIEECYVRAKWKNLRDTFRKEIYKFSVKSRESYAGNWRYFDDLWFLYNEQDFQFDEDDNEEEKDETMEAEYLSGSEYLSDPVSADESTVKTKHSRVEPELFINVDSSHRQDDDEFDLMYLKSLLPFFKQLNPIRKLVLRNKIQDLLIKEMSLNAGYITENGQDKK